MTESSTDPSVEPRDTISLGLAFQSVMMTQGACSSLLQWMAQQIGQDTESGQALRDAGIAIGSGDITPASGTRRAKSEQAQADAPTGSTDTPSQRASTTHPAGASTSTPSGTSTRASESEKDKS